MKLDRVATNRLKIGLSALAACLLVFILANRLILSYLDARDASHLALVHLPAFGHHSHFPKGVGSEDRNSMRLGTVKVFHKYTYTFGGTATQHNAPFAGASILVRLTTGEQTITMGGITNSDGSYAVSVPVTAEVNKPVDWIVEGYTPDFKKVQLVGRHIVTEEDKEGEEVKLDGPLAFLAE
jgi:hypothetical protein